jgi:response regulator RpfG family c-di-GMP phosphodiesterase
MQAMSNKILCVDDDPNILAGFQRHLRRQFAIDTAPGGEQGLAMIQAQGPYAVVVADLHMPGLNGIQFLSRVHQAAPDTVRIMLTGNADLQQAVQAVNEGHIFRFLTKPCPAQSLAQALAAGVEQYRLVVAEKELREKTLRGSVQVLTEVLSLVNPMAFSRASRAHRLVQQLVAELGVENAWPIEMAALLSQVGCVTVPESVLKKVYLKVDIDPEERRMFEAHPHAGHELIIRIPRLEEVAAIVAYQEKRFDGEGPPAEERRGHELPLGSRILKVALDFDSLELVGHTRSEALDRLRHRSGWYDPAVMDALERVLVGAAQLRVRSLTVPELKCPMVLAADVFLENGSLLVSKGQEITQPLLWRLQNFAARGLIRGPIQVLVPVV